MKFKNFVGRRGELTTQQIVVLIILIVSFGVLLFLIFRLNFQEISDKEICHNSVVLKGKSILKTGVLDCRTSYVCISGGGKCEGISATITRDINIKGTPEEVKNRIMDVLADEMADCWWMFGEGKVDYLGINAEGAAVGNVNCALCSIIAFDKNIREDEEIAEIISYEDFYNYLRLKEKDSGKTYLSYLYGVHNLDKLNEEVIKVPQGQISFNNQYYVLTGVGEIGALKKLANWGLNSVDALNSLLGLRNIVGGVPKFEKYTNLPVRLQEKDKLEELKCSDFVTKA